MEQEMTRTLVILEVSQKQNYIFGSKKLRENATRSANIAYVTGNAFFEAVARNLYRKRENWVYSGGGHTILQFDTPEQAVEFAKVVTRAAMKQFPGLELFVKKMPYQANWSPKENLEELTKRLERKKSVRETAFRPLSLGLEQRSPVTFRPMPMPMQISMSVPEQSEAGFRQPVRDVLKAPKDYSFSDSFDRLTGEEDPFIAIIHADGNAMGKRVERIYAQNQGSWEDCRRSLDQFSQGIQRDFETAFLEMVQDVIDQFKIEPSEALPIRPVILAGDDVCFVTTGDLGLECARIFLERLAAKKNQEDQTSYAACAGVALVHRTYPFHRAYELAEKLCDQAKHFGAEYDAEGRISAMDWHIEFGQLQDNLKAIREDYRTDDGCHLELRPVAVLVPQSAEKQPKDIRTYDFFRRMCAAMQGEYGKIARGKIKDLRVALKQGKIESRFFLHDKEIGNLLYHVFDARYTTDEERRTQYYRMLSDGPDPEKKIFVPTEDGKERCLFFDAIEMIDHCVFFKG